MSYFVRTFPVVFLYLYTLCVFLARYVFLFHYKRIRENLARRITAAIRRFPGRYGKIALVCLGNVVFFLLDSTARMCLGAYLSWFHLCRFLARLRRRGKKPGEEG